MHLQALLEIVFERKRRSSAIDVFFSVDEIQEAIFVAITLIDFLQFGVWTEHVLLVGEEDKSFLS